MSFGSDLLIAADSNWEFVRSARTARWKNSRRNLHLVRAFHQSHARAVNRIFVVPVVQLHLISDRFDFERRGNQKRCGQRDLSDHEQRG